MLLVLRYVLQAWGTLGRDRRDLVLETIALRQQLEVQTRTRRRPALQPGDRRLWSWLARVWPAWRQHLLIVQPDTVVRWHRAGWRRYSTWSSRVARRGRPRIDSTIAAAIRRMTTENPRWGHMHVLGALCELQKPGIRVSLQTVRRYRKDVPRVPASSWRTFLANRRPEIWACDFFTVHTLWFQTLYVFFSIAHDRRTVTHFNETAHPTAPWVWQQLIEATPWGEAPRYLLRDRDRSYGRRLRRACEAPRHRRRAHANRHASGEWHRRAARGHIPSRQRASHVQFLLRFPSRRAMQHARDRIREFTGRSQLRVSVEQVVQEVNRFLRAWAGYFRYGNSAHHFNAVETYAAMRLWLFVSKRRRWARRHGGRSVHWFAQSLGLLTLDGWVVAPRPNRPWRVQPNAVR